MCFLNLSEKIIITDSKNKIYWSGLRDRILRAKGIPGCHKFVEDATKQAKSETTQICRQLPYELPVRYRKYFYSFLLPFLFLSVIITIAIIIVTVIYYSI